MVSRKAAWQQNQNRELLLLILKIDDLNYTPQSMRIYTKIKSRIVQF